MTQNGNSIPGKKFTYGDAFVEEPTGSAPMINLDGQWEHDFVDDPSPAGEGEENSNDPDRISSAMDYYRNHW